MASVLLEGIKKIYDNGTVAVDDFNLSIKDGELLVLVGPSGCGKSSVLRMIAGLEDISEGTLLINGKRMNDVSPVTRNIAMVFQNYALYPHMTVRKNIELSLKIRGLPKLDRKLKVEETAKLLGLSEVLESRPAQLSGGQRQRVAMGRAIVRDPSVFLLDEPLSNLDAKLRAQVRSDICELQESLVATMVFVTHDQIEAMTMADRIVVMKNGLMQQVGTPNELYESPKNIFVADFIGSPSMNFLRGCLMQKGSSLQFKVLNKKTWDLPDVYLEQASEAATIIGKPVVLGVRPEHLSISGTHSGATGLSAIVKLIEPLGGETIVHLDVNGLRGANFIAVADHLGIADKKQADLRVEKSTRLVIKSQGKVQFAADDEVIVRLNDDSFVHLFDEESQSAIKGLIQ